MFFCFSCVFSPETKADFKDFFLNLKFLFFYFHFTMGYGDGQGQGQSDWNHGLFGCLSNPVNCEFCLTYYYYLLFILILPIVRFEIEEWPTFSA